MEIWIILSMVIISIFIIVLAIVGTFRKQYLASEQIVKEQEIVKNSEEKISSEQIVKEQEVVKNSKEKIDIVETENKCRDCGKKISEIYEIRERLCSSCSSKRYSRYIKSQINRIRLLIEKKKDKDKTFYDHWITKLTEIYTYYKSEEVFELRKKLMLEEKEYRKRILGTESWDDMMYETGKHDHTYKSPLKDDVYDEENTGRYSTRYYGPDTYSIYENMSDRD